MLAFLNRVKEESGVNEASDAALVQAAQRDPQAFVPLYRRYVTRIYRYLYSRTGSQADAEDLTSQVFTEALAGLAGYREKGQFAAWLFTIARRRLADFHRQRRPHQPLNQARNETAAAPSPPAQVAHNETLEHLAALVATLDEEKQELLRLRFAAGLTYAEIGRLIGRSEAATKMAVRRLLQRLAQDWEANDAP